MEDASGYRISENKIRNQKLKIFARETEGGVVIGVAPSSYETLSLFLEKVRDPLPEAEEGLGLPRTIF
jgi:hypothetical protein